MANSLIQQARVWVNEYGPGEGNPGGKLLVLGSEDVAEVDEDYDTSVAKLKEVDEQQGQLPKLIKKRFVSKISFPGTEQTSSVYVYSLSA